VNPPQIFSDGVLRIEVASRSRMMRSLLERFLDFRPAGKGAGTVRTRFSLEEADPAPRRRGRSSIHRSSVRWSGQREIRSGCFGSCAARAEVDLAGGSVRGTWSGYSPRVKERLLQHLFTLPLQRMLCARGWYFLHAALTEDRGRRVLICGPAGAGKSTMTVVLAKHGFNPLSDDDCFIRRTRAGVRVRPFPTKVGVGEPLFRRYSELRRDAVKRFRYYGKRRVSLDALGRRPSPVERACAAILFPAYRPRSAPALRRLPRSEALRRLLKATLIRLYPETEHDLLCAFFEFTSRTPAFELSFHDGCWEDLPAMVRSLWAIR